MEERKGIIGICDDEEAVAKKLQKIVEGLCEKNKWNWEVKIYLSGNEILQDLANLSIVFVDIEMPGMDGIQLGRAMKEQKNSCKIIMATGNLERFKEAFYINAMRYVTKPFDEVEIEEALNAAIGSDLAELTLEVYQQRNKYQLRQADIQYIEAFSGYAEIISFEQVFRKDVSLDDLETMLDQRLFVRINRKNIVNLLFVRPCKTTNVQVNNVEMPVSRRKKKDFERKYVEFELKYRRELL